MFTDMHIDIDKRTDMWKDTCMDECGYVLEISIGTCVSMRVDMYIDLGIRCLHWKTSLPVEQKMATATTQLTPC